MPELFDAVPTEPETLKLPAITIRPIKTAIGQIRHVLRPATVVSVSSVEEVRVSPRKKGALYTLSNGEKLVLAVGRGHDRPEAADGVIVRSDTGELEWHTHRLIEGFESEVAAKGLPETAKALATKWNGKFLFKAEVANADGTVDPSNRGLRPPQIGALYAIGAHWSLSSHPATIVMPTGTGKTETMLSALANFIRGPLLVVVPSDILRSQTARKFLTFGLLRELGALSLDAPNPIVGIVTKRPRSSADLKMLSECNVIIATMSSIGEGAATGLAGDIANFISTLIVDEAHHIGAKGWSAFKEALAKRKVLQFTATPFRRDGKLVDGQVIYNYPLGRAQQDGYFKKISFEPVHEINPERADATLAQAAVAKLRADLAGGLNHLMMARCVSIERATAVHSIYEAIAPDLNPMLVHSELGDTDERIAILRSGQSRIVVCVNMLGEGFDLPELKLAAIHDLHKSLAILLQFTGRFTRSAGANIGDATVLANIADPQVTAALERLYSEDADWNQLLSELSSEAAREHAELVAFLSSAQRLDTPEDSDEEVISHQLLRPTLSTLFFRADQFQPKRFYEGLPDGMIVRGVWLHSASHTLFFVTKTELAVKWSRSKSLLDRQWALFVLHYDEGQGLLYLSSSDHSSTFPELATAVGASELVSGDAIFRSLGRINRLIFQNVGVKKHGRRNLRFAMYTGADVAQALGIAEQAGSVKSNLSGTGWEEGRPVTIGCSFKGRVWSREQGPIPRFVGWSEAVGAKINDDTIDTKNVIANVLIPEECTILPDKPVLGIEWPLELLGQSEERVVFHRAGQEEQLSIMDIQFVRSEPDTNRIIFELIDATGEQWGQYQMVLGGDQGFTVERASEVPVEIQIGSLRMPVESNFSNYPPLVRFIDLSELDGNLLIKPNSPRDLIIPPERFEVWPWDGVDIRKESIWKDGAQRQDSIQWRAAEHYIGASFDVVFDDDSAGEAADLVCLKEMGDHIKLALVHCKFSSGSSAGERVKDAVEVSSQAVRSAKWKWKFRDLIRHLFAREAKLVGNGRTTRFLAGSPADLNRISRVSRFKEIRPEILIVQPGISKAGLTSDQSAVLAAAMSYLKETIGVDLDVICSD